VSVTPEPAVSLQIQLGDRNCIAVAITVAVDQSPDGPEWMVETMVRWNDVGRRSREP
jgi:hypothetical protein